MKHTKTSDTITLPPEVGGFMERHVNANLLRYAAGRAITCPNCGNIMDCRRTVIASVYGNMPGNPEKLAVQHCVCAGCWDKLGHVVSEGMGRIKQKHPEVVLRLEIVDGRNYLEEL